MLRAEELRSSSWRIGELEAQQPNISLVIQSFEFPLHPVWGKFVVKPSFRTP